MIQLQIKLHCPNRSALRFNFDKSFPDMSILRQHLIKQFAHEKNKKDYKSMRFNSIFIRFRLIQENFVRAKVNEL